MQINKEGSSNLFQKQNSVIQFCNSQDHSKKGVQDEEENLKESLQSRHENQKLSSEQDDQNTPKFSLNNSKKPIKWIKSCKVTQERQKLDKKNSINSQANKIQQDASLSYNGRARQSSQFQESQKNDCEIEKEYNQSEMNDLEKKSIEIMKNSTDQENLENNKNVNDLSQSKQSFQSVRILNLFIIQIEFVLLLQYHFPKSNVNINRKVTLWSFHSFFLVFTTNLEFFVSDFSKRKILFTLINVIALMLSDYSYRANGNDYLEYGLNQAKFVLEIISNTGLTFLALINIISVGFILGKNTFMRYKWNIFNLIVLIISWITIKSNDIEVLNIIKIFRVLFFHQVDCFLSGFKELWKPFIPFFSVVLLYSVIGLYFFNGLLESRCRTTSDPQLDPYSWPILEDHHFLCGYSSCPSDSYCRNPSDYDLPPIPSDNSSIELFYGLTNFDSIWESMYTVQTFFTVNGWVQITEIVKNNYQAFFK